MIGASTREIAKRKHLRISAGKGACGAGVGFFYDDPRLVTCPVCRRAIRQRQRSGR